MKYDNIEFDTVKQLYEYRQLEKKTKAPVVKVKSTGNKKRNNTSWTDEETLFLKQLVSKNKSIKYIARNLKRTEAAVSNRKYQLKLNGALIA